MNRPYEIPSRHWMADENGYLKAKKGRRISEYRVMHAGKAPKNTSDALNIREDRLPGIAYQFETVEILRDEMKSWRAQSYPGCSPVTRKLLQHWTSEDRHVRLFFCQIEAIETFIYLAETSRGQAEAKKIDGDTGAIERWCAKMATGTGKTVVMAMLIAWQTLNWHKNRETSKYTKNFLAVTPGLTVKDRLSVLHPHNTSNYYDQFNLLPPGDSKDILCAHTKLLIVNWHKLMWQTDEELAKKRGVDKRGALSDKAWLAELAGRKLPESEPVAVINDEAHHAWRLSAENTESDYLKKDLDNATRWMKGLDRLHKATRVARCYDFTATPFTPQGRSAKVSEKMFNWVVSDFGLNDAIEAGLVKTPRIPTRDNTVQSEQENGQIPDSYLYHIYEEEGVKEKLKPSEDENSRLPDKVIDAYKILSESWKRTSDAWKASEIPPVMVSVANNTKTAKRVENMFLKQKEIDVEGLKDENTTLRIDSTVLASAEKNGKSNIEAEILRETVRTVGDSNGLGGQICNVISVEMLSEGWDAKNVTHIMGLRAFTSQLLCEQVIGRGLRRTDYQPDEDGYLKPDHVRIFGVPFVLMLQQEDEDDGGSKNPPEPPLDIFAHPDKKNREIWFPDIERIDYGEIERITLRPEDIPPMTIDGDKVLTEASMADAMPWLKAQNGEIITNTTVEKMRNQTLAFRAAAQICAETPELSLNHTFPQIANLINKFAESPRFNVSGGQDKNLIAKYRMYAIAEHIKNNVLAIQAKMSARGTKMPIYRDPHNPLRTTSEMIPWGTRAKKTKIYDDPKKCHMNKVVCDTKLEHKIAQALNSHRNVEAWGKNDREHIGFRVRYLYGGVVRDYIPDFIARLADGTNLIVEAKGELEPEAYTKQDYMDNWVEAVNAEGRWGTWENAGLVFLENIPELKLRLDEANKK